MFERADFEKKVELFLHNPAIQSRAGMTNETQREDEEFVGRLVRGESDAFTALYRMYGGPVYRFALYMSGSSGHAEEITQETFLFVLANAKAFDAARGTLLSWLLGVARNLSRRSMAHAAMTEPLDDLAETETGEAPDLCQAFEQQELVEAVRRGVQSLPAPLREVVILCELQELGYKEAAAVIGCPVGTVRSRLNRARGLLVSKLKVGCSV
jgi:RNA polymerase sigma-70 factor, ECF subfamily